MQTKTGLFTYVSRSAGLLLLASGFLWVANARADNHTLVAHYAFDTTDAGNDVQGIDSSGNGNDMTFGAGGGGGGVYVTADAAAGPLAIQFSAGPDGDGLGVLSGSPTPAQLLSAMAGSFTVSCWIKTTQVFASEGDPAWEGAGIVAGDVYGTANDYVPIALTGGEIAFTTGGPNGDDTLSSIDDSVNDGNYHLITVTRNQTSGLKKIYIDGELDNEGYGVTNSLSDTQQIDIGSLGDGGDPNPGDLGFYNQYVGNLDDLQFYSGVLNDTEVAYLYNNPGSTAPNINIATPNLVAHYTFDDSGNIGADTSGLGNDLDFNSTAGGGGGVVFSASAEAGPGAAYFDGGSFLSYSSAPATVLSTLGSSFTLSVWINTSITSGTDGDPAWADAGIVAADIPGAFRDIVPMALTGSGIGINTGDDPNHYSVGESTLNSYANVVDGTYHHVVVTRDEATGNRQIYVDGALSANDSATTYYLRDPVEVGVGARIDASQANPNNADIGGPYYQGLLDDVQLYNCVLTPDQINFLYQNPGQVVTNAPPDPVDVDLTLTIQSQIDPVNGLLYLAYPSVNNLTPNPTTTNFVISPYRDYVTYDWPDGGYGASLVTSTLGEVLDEFTNSYWTIAVNAGAPNEQIFHFQVSISDLDTNAFPQVQILVPAYNATDVATNTPFEWSGPTNYSYIAVTDESSNYANYFYNSYDTSVTNWSSPPEAFPGTNVFTVSYYSNNFPGLTYSSPINTLQLPLDSWNANADLQSDSSSQFVVVGALLPVTLVDVAPVAGGIQFSFTSQIGTSNTVQSTTNLSCHNCWMDVTNFVGDGTVWQFVFPTTNPPVQFFRVKTQ